MIPVLFTSDGCPMCAILKEHMNMARIAFDECKDADRARQLGVQSLPALLVTEGGTPMRFPEAMAWVAKMKEDGSDSR